MMAEQAGAANPSVAPRRWLAAALLSDNATRAISIVTAAFTVPYTLHSLGLARYGVIALAATILSVVSNVDGGIVGSMQRFFALHVGSSDAFAVRRLAVSAAALLPAIGAVAALIVWLITPGLVQLTHIPSAYQSESVSYIRIVALTMVVTAFADVWLGLLRAQHRWSTLSAVSAGGQLLYVPLLVVGLAHSPTLMAVAVATVGQTLFGAVCVSILGVRAVPALAARPEGEPTGTSSRWMSRSEWSAVLAHGRQMLSTNLSVVINVEFDSLLIAVLFPVDQLGLFAIGSRLAALVRGLPMGALGGFISQFSRQAGKGELDATTLDGPQRAWTSVIAGYTVVAVASAAPAINLWLGHGYLLATVIAMLLMAGYGVNLLTGVLTSYLRAVGRPDVEARYSWVTTVLNIGITIPATLSLGAYGVALGTCLAQILGSVSLVRLARTHVGPASNFFRHLRASRLVALGLIAGSVSWLVARAPVSGVPGLFLAGGTAGACLLGYLVATDALQPVLARADVLKKLEGMIRMHPPLPEPATAPSARSGHVAPRGLVCVYRAKNAQTVTRLVEQARASDSAWDIRLWALDAPAEDLAEWTVGTGPGTKFELCNRLVDGRQWEYTVVADDDVDCQGLDRLIALMGRHGLDLAQPAHRLRSVSTYRFCRQRPWLQARETNFIEIGPLFAIGPRHRDSVLPFPADIGMGWGLEFDWFAVHQREQMTMGIVDRVTMRHLGALGAAYDMEVEGRRLRQRLDEHGVGRVEDFQRTLRRVYRFARRRAITPAGQVPAPTGTHG